MDPGDLADPDAVLAALDRVTFLVSLELRHSDVTQRADVVFPVAPAAAKSGTYLNWEAAHAASLPHCRIVQIPICGCSMRWPTKWVSASDCPTSRPPATS
ncbi:putative nADH dehydrogenase I nuog [Mycobacterium xenopi 4042]|uniref:Putative nADH dehydrogenase I nuog n=1 Tax=Mycobacterium xenopi 4042 TaxID=1299334 RepID=X7ZVG0_MYCXE|nr:putative nADH dehydrogenase I nuog [Mycobacterium xenopi 4042]